MVEMVLGLGHSHSPVAHPKPAVPRPQMIRAMLEAGRAHQDADD